LSDGRILSWSGDETLKLWDAVSGRQQSTWAFDKAAIEAPELWRAYKNQVSPNTLTGEGWADRLKRGIACFFLELNTRILWQGEGPWTAWHLLPDGKIVVTCHKHLEFLALYNGNRRVDLSEAAGLLAAQED
jgi:hypothetical protein